MLCSKSSPVSVLSLLFKNAFRCLPCLLFLFCTSVLCCEELTCKKRRFMSLCLRLQVLLISCSVLIRKFQMVFGLIWALNKKYRLVIPYEGSRPGSETLWNDSFRDDLDTRSLWAIFGPFWK